MLGAEKDDLGAARELRRAVDLSPSHAEAQALMGRALAECGLLDDGIARLRVALGMDDRMQLARVDLARLSALRGDWEFGDELLASRRDDEVGNTILALTRVRLALWRRDIDGARSIAETLRGTGSADLVEALLGASSRVPRASTMRRRAFAAQIAVEQHLVAGRHDLALTALEEATRCGLMDLAWADHCPLLGVLGAEERFAAARSVVESRAAAVRELLT